MQPGYEIRTAIFTQSQVQIIVSTIGAAGNAHGCKKFSGFERKFREIPSDSETVAARLFPESRENQFPNYISRLAVPAGRQATKTDQDPNHN